VEELRPIWWENNRAHILDQRALPNRRRVIVCERPEHVAEAIRSMAIRGAPALGVAAAMGIALAALGGGARDDILARAEKAGQLMIATRPTAYNIRWAAERMLGRARETDGSVGDIKERLVAEALSIEREDYDACRSMGELGARLLQDGDRVLTHCKRP
jgi:methylthioribose-1-phosphate isomerase